MLGSLLLALVTTQDLGSLRPETPVHPQRLLLRLTPDVPAASLASLHDSLGARVLWTLPQIGWQAVEVADGERDAARAAYQRSPLVRRADLDRARPVAHVPNDPMYPGMWHMPRITADLAWDTERGSSDVQVAVMDTGLEVTHPDLAANVWTNAGEIPGNGIDDDGNGYVDDVHGYDFAYLDGDPDDQYGHGTACAGIVASVQDNSIGCTGVAPGVQLVGVKASTNAGYFYDSANVPALVYCADMGFEVISMSFYSDQVTPAERDAIDYCWEHNVLPVAAAGNSYQVYPFYPGAYEHVVSVAATSTSDQKASFSDWGSWVDVAAPGVSLTTTAVGGSYTTGFAGTSGATPHVAGLAALLYSAKPGATNRAVRRALEDTARPLIESPYGEYTNYGLIDCAAAVDRVMGLTSGARAGRLLFASPLAAPGTPTAGSGTGDAPEVLIYGVGLERANQVRVLRDGIPESIVRRHRNFVTVRPSPRTGGSVFGTPELFELEVNGVVVGSFVFHWTAPDPGDPSHAGEHWYSPADACSVYDGTATGGFAELREADGQQFVANRRSDGLLYVEYSLRKVHPAAAAEATLEYTRTHHNATGGTETFQLYDWSTGSYPYGSFVTISSGTVPDDQPHTLVVDLPGDPRRFVDDEGTMYALVSTTGAGSGATLAADLVRVRFR